MKQPRTSAFDPNAEEHTADADKSVKSLKSSMQDFPVIAQPQASQQREVQNHAAEPLLPALPVRDVRGVRSEPPVDPRNPDRRKIKSRHPFDIYEDQLDELKALAVEDRMRGGPGSMSAMVRQAIDDYVAKASQKWAE